MTTMPTAQINCIVHTTNAYLDKTACGRHTAAASTISVSVTMMPRIARTW